MWIVNICCGFVSYFGRRGYIIYLLRKIMEYNISKKAKTKDLVQIKDRQDYANISGGGTAVTFGRCGLDRDTGLVYAISGQDYVGISKKTETGDLVRTRDKQDDANISGGTASIGFGRGGVDRDTNLVYAISEEEFGDSKIYNKIR